jgi:hypothetical protein
MDYADLSKVDSRDLFDLLASVVLLKESAFKAYQKAQTSNTVKANRLQLLQKSLTNEEVKIAAIRQELLVRIERSSVAYIESLVASTILTDEQAKNLIKVCAIIRAKQSASMANTRNLQLVYKDDETIVAERQETTEAINKLAPSICE